MGSKLLWTGLTMMLALEKFIPELTIAGAVVMIIGLILMWLDK